ncbi:hypothetical protein K443DRAFT_682372 [Laccaria amethystina LaAM-08-1]|uniref:Uncharacterized protein n=1 Tax=Laccaria amethystina LaAM-08-1 TaxID=1095629 RepID=A0A0C9X4Z3_9AGAR|nr:hypothetical protein K443DRAFT_682372 [Laccaria amethystina LaAM-08-1]
MPGNRRHIPKPVKEQLVYMSTRMRSSGIAHVTGISHRTVNRVLHPSRTTGSVIRVPYQAGRPRLLNALDASFLEGLHQENYTST